MSSISVIGLGAMARAMGACAVEGGHAVEVMRTDAHILMTPQCRELHRPSDLPRWARVERRSPATYHHSTQIPSSAGS